MPRPNFSARGGEQIVGNLFRGKSGKFQSGPTDAGLKKLGIQRELSDALINALANKNLTPAQIADLKQRGLMDESGILTRNGRSLALALKSKNLTNAKKILDSIGKKKASKGGGGGSVDKKAEAQKKSRGVLRGLGFNKSLIDSLFSFFDGSEIDEKQTQAFVKSGLMQIGANGLARLTRPGRMLRTAVNSGDSRKIQDAITRANDFAKKELEKQAEEMTMLDVYEEETAVDDITDFDDFEEGYGMAMPYVHGATSFEQLKVAKEAQMMRMNVQQTTDAFQGMVNNIVFGESETKLDDLNGLFREYTDIMTGILSGDIEEQEIELQEKAIPVHHTAVVENEPWDGQKARANAPNDAKVLRYMSAWVEEGGDPSTKQSYKFPHHQPQVDAPANIRGVNNGLARLSQANIPDADRAGVERHLRAHRVDAGLTESLAEGEIKTAVATIALSEGMTKEEKAQLLETVTEQEINFAENNPEFGLVGDVVNLQESNTPDTPLFIDVRLIKPGWGNKRDNNYYPPDMLRRDAKVFNEVKMHVTNHKDAEQNDRFWVSTITEAGERFTDTGAPIVRTAVHDPIFAQRVRNLKELGLLYMLQCSIVAAGRVKPNFKEGDRKGAMVESITYAKSVDWVTKAGAGGQALNLIESSHLEDEQMNEQEQEVTEQEEQTQETLLTENNDEQPDEAPNNEDNNEQQVGDSEENEPESDEPVFLERSALNELLNDTVLPDVAKNRLLEREFATLDDAQTAVQKEIDYIASVTGAAKPHQFDAGANETVVEFDEEKANARFDNIFEEFGIK